MKSTLLDPYGSFLPALWYHDVRERLRGETERANARWGWLRAPPGDGRLIWIACGTQRETIRLGVELARSVREKRRDARVLLTFEHEHPDLLAPLAALERCGFGFAPADHAGSVRRALSRLVPLGIVLCGSLPRRRFAAACSAQRHVLAFDPPQRDSRLSVERTYPSSDALTWPENSAPAADFLALLVPTRVEPDFARLVNGESQRHLWWWHGADARQALRFIALLRGHFREDVLLVSGTAALQLTQTAPGVVPISRWQRQCLAAGSVVLIDEAQWLATVAACATAVHLASIERETLWQALAGAGAVSCSDHAQLPDTSLATAVQVCPDEDAVLRQWQQYRADAAAAAAHAAAARQRFKDECGRAADVAAELMQRIFEWR